MFRAKSVKWGELYRAFVAWRRLNCTMMHDAETGEVVHMRDEHCTTDPPELPGRDAVVLTPAELDTTLRQMQQRVWGDWHGSWLQRQRQQAETAQRELPQTPWDVSRLAAWAMASGQHLTGQLMPPRRFSFATQFAADLFDLLVYYFAGNEAGFLAKGYKLAAQEPSIDVETLSIHKGLAFFGSPGVGKTMLLRTFQQNPIRPYGLVSAKQVELAYRAGVEGRQAQARLGGATGKHLCIDDVATEAAVVKDFGNAEAPLARVILDRYDRYQMGLLSRWATHLSSNNALHRSDDVPADMPTWDELYGERVVDRLYELCNIIPFVGGSRRG